MMNSCRACGNRFRLKISNSWASNRGRRIPGSKWICKNRKACLRRQQKKYNNMPFVR